MRRAVASRSSPPQRPCISGDGGRHHTTPRPAVLARHALARAATEGAVFLPLADDLAGNTFDGPAAACERVNERPGGHACRVSVAAVELLARPSVQRDAAAAAAATNGAPAGVRANAQATPCTQDAAPHPPQHRSVTEHNGAWAAASATNLEHSLRVAASAAPSSNGVAQPLSRDQQHNRGDTWPPRAPEQLHVPLSPPSTSASSDATDHAAPRMGTTRRRPQHGAAHPARGAHAHPQQPHQQQQQQQHSHSPRRHASLLARVEAATNWYEVRAVLIANTAGTCDSDAASRDVVLAVLRRLAAVTRYTMRPPESASLGSFLERWLMEHLIALRAMGPAELSLCLHSLAKLATALPAPPTPWAVAWFGAAQPYLLGAAFRPKDISLTLWALSRMQLRLPPAAVQLLLAAAEPHLGRFNGQDLSLVALALSSLRMRTQQPPAAGPAAQAAGGGGGSSSRATQPRPLVSAAWRERYLARVSEVLPTCGSQALANLLHGAVHAGLQPPHSLLADLCAAQLALLPESTPQALANSVSALAACGFAPRADWVEAFLAESGARMGSEAPPRMRCNADDLAHLAAAAAALRLRPPRWWVAQLHEAVEGAVPRAGPRQLAQMLHGLAQLHRSVAAAASAAGAAGAGVLAAGPPTAGTGPAPPGAGAAAALHEGGGRASSSSGGPAFSARPPRSLLAAWQAAATAAMPSFCATDASHSLWALAVLGESPPPAWLQRLLVTVRASLPSAPASELAVLLWSLAALRFKPTWSWLADCVDATTPALASMCGQDYAMLTSAMARLGARPSSDWSDALLRALRPRLADLGPRCLAQTAWAIYRLRVQPPPEWLEGLVEALASQWGGGGGSDALRAAARERLELRHVALMLWVASKWLGPQRRVALRRLRDMQRPPLAWRRRAAGGGRGASGGGEVGEGAPAASPHATHHAPPEPLPSPDAAAPHARACRLSARMLRRRRAPRPGSLVASLGGNVAAAAALRDRLAAGLLAPALAASEPLLHAANAQDVALLAAAAAALRRAARRAAADRPTWLQGLVTAARPCLCDMPAAGLLQLAACLHALEAEVQPGWAAECARAALPHVYGRGPAAERAALLQRVCRLRVVPSSSRHSDDDGAPERGRAPRDARSAPAAGGRAAAWGPLLARGLRVMRQASGAARPLLRLHLNLLKAQVRLHKLRAAASESGVSSGAGALAVAERVMHATAAAAGASGAGARRPPSGPYHVATLNAATSTLRYSVAAAVAAVISGADAADDEPRWRRRGCMPCLSEVARKWIWARARRTAAAHLAESSPVVVTQLVRLVAELADVRAPPNPGASGLAAAGWAGSGGGGEGPQQQSDARGHTLLACDDYSLLWLARSTRRCWRRMRPAHRARVERAWRRVLQALVLGRAEMAGRVEQALPGALRITARRATASGLVVRRTGR